MNKFVEGNGFKSGETKPLILVVVVPQVLMAYKTSLTAIVKKGLSLGGHLIVLEGSSPSCVHVHVYVSVHINKC